MNKSGYYYFSHLSTSQKIKFRENLRKRKKNFRDYLSFHWKDMNSFLGSAFMWVDTKQGHDYWSNLTKKFKNL